MTRTPTSNVLHTDDVLQGVPFYEKSLVRKAPHKLDPEEEAIKEERKLLHELNKQEWEEELKKQKELFEQELKKREELFGKKQMRAPDTGTVSLNVTSGVQGAPYTSIKTLHVPQGAQSLTLTYIIISQEPVLGNAAKHLQ